MRRHSSGPSISGMYQSEITMGTRASWSSSQASRPFCALRTSHPAAFASAPSWALDTGSSSTTSTEIALAIHAAFHGRLQVVERGPRLSTYLLDFVTRAAQVAIACGALHFLEQLGEASRTDRPRRRLERMGRPLDRLGIRVLHRCGEGPEALWQRFDEGREDPVHRLGRPGFLHGATELR